MLLSHTSGFPNLRVLNRDRKLNINFEPGSRFAYSGEGIQLLQLVVEDDCPTAARGVDAGARISAAWNDAHQHGH
jgi:hypothetical protein